MSLKLSLCINDLSYAFPTFYYHAKTKCFTTDNFNQKYYKNYACNGKKLHGDGCLSHDQYINHATFRLK